MAEIIVLNHVSLDGVMQAPGRPDEDQRGGFTLGGWAASRTDHVMGEHMGRGMAAGGSLLLGRLTYEQFAAFWPHQTDNPYTEVLDRQTKYVVSSSMVEPLPWQNSVLLSSVDDVAEVKASSDGQLTVMGSGVLLEALRQRGLVDRYELMVHPVLLGSGRRLFSDGFPSLDLTLTDSVTSTTGVIIATYEPVR